MTSQRCPAHVPAKFLSLFQGSLAVTIRTLKAQVTAKISSPGELRHFSSLLDCAYYPIGSDLPASRTWRFIRLRAHHFYHMSRTDALWPFLQLLITFLFSVACSILPSFRAQLLDLGGAWSLDAGSTKSARLTDRLALSLHSPYVFIFCWGNDSQFFDVPSPFLATHHWLILDSKRRPNQSHDWFYSF